MKNNLKTKNVDARILEFRKILNFWKFFNHDIMENIMTKKTLKMKT